MTPDMLAPLRALVAAWREEHAMPYGRRYGNRVLVDCADDLAAALPALEAEIARLREESEAALTEASEAYVELQARVQALEAEIERLGEERDAAKGDGVAVGRLSGDLLVADMRQRYEARVQALDAARTPDGMDGAIRILCESVWTVSARRAVTELRQRAQAMHDHASETTSHGRAQRYVITQMIMAIQALEATDYVED